MGNLLYIKASPKQSTFSNTLLLGDEFIRTYRAFHPSESITIIDLYQYGINFLSCDAALSIFKDNDNLTPEETTALGHLFSHVDQFVDADKYVIAAPMWNLSIPAILKAYIDNIVLPEKTFTFRDGTPVGLLTGRKALHITSRGSYYDKAPHTEFGDSYLRAIFAFMGIQDFSTVALEGTSLLNDKEKEDQMNQTLHNIRSLAIKF